MTRIDMTLAAIAAAVIASPAAAAQDQAKKVETVEVKKTVRIVDGKEVQGPATDVEKLVASCGARNFETTAEMNKDGKKRVTKIKLCAKPGESDAAWVATLKDARGKLEKMEDMSPESRTKIAADLNAEIARLEKAN
ncbi:hypothetical protein H9L12_07755 [Sphingomonas rhizophila]|uniref:Uncharacterized protein n=1 Tax=Sphingomonas rhizophila TaxID=2071607 RepID=A0A7G9S8T0_9SPHN|nr:hypothetical protein [Sphingomonas rhizophila]QNN64255.1 hypothetical protein H9L12_07755 [Sphingomonas rhizophila]